jgi:hypothetical protein
MAPPGADGQRWSRASQHEQLWEPPHHSPCALSYGAPSGSFAANSAWLVIAALAHNLLRWTALLGGLASANIVAKTVRRYLVLAGRLTRSGRRDTLHLPKQWPRQRAFLAALRRIRLIAIC